MPSSGLDVNYHLLRVRVKKHVFYRLQNLALEDRHSTGEYTTVSDLVRSAIIDWLHVHDAARRLETFGGPNKAFRPSGLAIPSELIEPLLHDSHPADDDEMDLEMEREEDEVDPDDGADADEEDIESQEE